jgi:hypothetical protein
MVEGFSVMAAGWELSEEFLTKMDKARNVVDSEEFSGFRTVQRNQTVASRFV